jgi:hypothetical protein
MLPYLYVFPTKEEETQKYIDYLNGYVSQILEHIYGGSSAKFICICGISFYIYGIASNETFINMWLNMLFNDAQQILERQVPYYDSLNPPEYILNKISFDKTTNIIFL